MRATSFCNSSSVSKEISSTFVQSNARMCSVQNFGKVCKALWPYKTTEELASRAHCSVRAAAYEISGEREASANSILAVITEMLRRD